MGTYSGDQAESMLNDGKRKLNEVTRKAGEGIDSMKSSIGHAAEQLSEKAQNMVSPETAQHVRETVEQVRDRTIEQYDNLTDRVRREPVTALAIAAGCGLLIGLLLRRSN